MRKGRKLFYCAVMTVIIAAAVLLESITLTRDKNIHSMTDTISDSESDTESGTARETESDAAEANADGSSQRPEGAEKPDMGTGDGSFQNVETVLDEETESQIDDIIAGMTVEEKVGQMFFIKNDGRFGPEILEEYPVGGIILFSGDFRQKTPDSLAEYIAGFQAASPYPLLVGTDEEGGTVVRVSANSKLAEEKFLSPRELYAAGGFNAIAEDTETKSKLLLSYGINVNFAPVCDVSTNPKDYMYERAFGSSAGEASEYVELVVRSMDEAGIGSVLKHFPGYGDNGDTHKSIIYDKRDYEVFETSDFLPFLAGIDAGADCVLVSHNIVECIDDAWPASLSYSVHDILRNELGFGGVIVTDDLMMSGVSDYVDEREAAIRAIQAGNDMILSTDFEVQYLAVLTAVQEGAISEERLNRSVARILRWKYSLGLM